MRTTPPAAAALSRARTLPGALLAPQCIISSRARHAESRPSETGATFICVFVHIRRRHPQFMHRDTGAQAVPGPVSRRGPGQSQNHRGRPQSPHAMRHSFKPPVCHIYNQVFSDGVSRPGRLATGVLGEDTSGSDCSPPGYFTWLFGGLGLSAAPASMGHPANHSCCPGAYTCRDLECSSALGVDLA